MTKLLPVACESSTAVLVHLLLLPAPTCLFGDYGALVVAGDAFSVENRCFQFEQAQQVLRPSPACAAHDSYTADKPVAAETVVTQQPCFLDDFWCYACRIIHTSAASERPKAWADPRELGTDNPSKRRGHGHPHALVRELAGSG